MKLSAKELTAINWFIHKHNYGLKLCTPPTMYFTDRATGNEVTYDLSNILTLYGHWNKEDQKERARERKDAKRQEANSTRRFI